MSLSPPDQPLGPQLRDPKDTFSAFDAIKKVFFLKGYFTDRLDAGESPVAPWQPNGKVDK